ncbi:MAG: polymerase beta, Nucleotidyltransferase [Pseudomonadota bacterium]|jgi:predicted nucleotidyltransferase
MILAKLTARRLSHVETELLVKRAVEWIQKNFKPRAIWLFGSMAGNEATEFSDIDIAAVFDSESELKEARNTGIFNLSQYLGQPADLLLYARETFLRKSQSGGVCEIIINEGVCLNDSQA